MRWIYVITAVPTLTEWLETGHLPVSLRDGITDITLTVMLLGLAWIIRRQQDRLAVLAETDGLTGLGNSRSFHRDLHREAARARRRESPLSLVILDMDGFKGINDRYGHAEGDAVLARFAGVLAGGVRPRVDRVYRIGGDEFALLLPDTEERDAGNRVERIRVLSRAEPAALDRYGAGVSFGVVALRAGEDVPTFIRRADERMYAAKAEGRNVGASGGRSV